MLYRLARAILRLFLVVLYRPRVEGRDLVPRNGALVLCSNHISWWDPVTVASVISRKVHFMAKEELFRGPFAIILPALGAFPVRRGTPDRKAIKRALEVLKRGGVVGLFPEGTRSRSRDLKPAEPGVALLGSRAKVPMVPVAIRGPYRVGSRLIVAVGSPIYLDGRDHERNSARVMEAIGLLMGDAGDPGGLRADGP